MLQDKEEEEEEVALAVDAWDGADSNPNTMQGSKSDGCKRKKKIIIKRLRRESDRLSTPRPFYRSNGEAPFCVWELCVCARQDLREQCVPAFCQFHPPV